MKYIALTAGSPQTITADVVEEAQVCLSVNGQELATWMCSPHQLEWLALGFLANEGVIGSLADVHHVHMAKSGRCLDVWLNAEGQVMELHLSVAVDGEQHYKARGLTLQPTVVRRFLERIDLRYDPRRPAPLETRLSSGDRVVLGQGDQATTLEFIMLPREER